MIAFLLFLAIRLPSSAPISTPRIDHATLLVVRMAKKVSHTKRVGSSIKEAEPQHPPSDGKDTHEETNSDMTPPEDNRPTVS